GGVLLLVLISLRFGEHRTRCPDAVQQRQHATGDGEPQRSHERFPFVMRFIGPRSARSAEDGRLGTQLLFLMPPADSAWGKHRSVMPEMHRTRNIPCISCA